MYTYTMPKKPKPRVRVQVYLDADQHAALKRLRVETRVKVSDYIREGADLVLKKYHKRK